MLQEEIDGISVEVWVTVGQKIPQLTNMMHASSSSRTSNLSQVQ